jgi:hypothetical protein
MAFGYASPSAGPGGDGDQDDAAAKKTVGNAGGIWTPECWHKSPEQMIAEARAMNAACFAHVAAHAHKHSNPPQFADQRSI